MSRTLYLSPPSFDGFDGGAGARYQARPAAQVYRASHAAFIPLVVFASVHQHVRLAGGQHSFIALDIDLLYARLGVVYEFQESWTVLHVFSTIIPPARGGQRLSLA